ncbi:heavy metal-binding domain-containing protein [Elusimicrobiota bacterium]
MTIKKIGLITGVAVIFSATIVSTKDFTKGKNSEYKKHACPYKMKMMNKNPMRIEGATTEIKNTEDGVMILITGKDPKTIAKIQANALHMKNCKGKEHGKGGKKGHKCTGDCKGKCKEGKYKHGKDGKKGHKCTGDCKGKCKHGKGKHMKKKAAKGEFYCPMGCYISPKPGKCPKCKMELKKK